MAKRTSESSFIDDGVSTLFHSLPIEVVVEILAFASLLSTKTALSICLVATWTNALGREGLYGLVVLSNTLHLYMFIDAVGYKSTIYRDADPFNLSRMMDIVKEKTLGYIHPKSPAPSELRRGDGKHARQSPKSDLLPMVRNLWLPTGFFNHKPMNTVIAACKNLWSLSIPSFFLRFVVEGTLEQTGLRHLMLTTPAFRYDWRESHIERNHILCNITHLFIATAEENSCFVPVNKLPSLEHLAIPLIIAGGGSKESVEFDVAARFLHFEQLQMIVVHYKEKIIRRILPRRAVEGLVINANAFNSRLYAMPLNSLSEIKGLWRSTARGRDSVWTDAKVVLKHAKHALVKS